MNESAPPADYSLTCDACGKELGGGPLDHFTDEDRRACPAHPEYVGGDIAAAYRWHKERHQAGLELGYFNHSLNDDSVICEGCREVYSEGDHYPDDPDKMIMGLTTLPCDTCGADPMYRGENPCAKV